MKSCHFGKLFILAFITIFISGCSITPKPFTPKEINSNIKDDLKVLNKLSETVKQPITLNDAINRAINNNLKNKIQIMQSALAQNQIDLVYYDMLPSLTASAGYLQRDSYAASASTSFTNGVPNPLGANPNYSVSQDKQRINTDISFSWNILDFGLSYIRANQEADKFLIAKENERKVINNIKQEVRRSYYQAIVANDLLEKIKPMMLEVEDAIKNSDSIKNNRVKSPFDVLIYQRELFDILKALQNLEKTLINAKIELSQLMGLKPGTQFNLAEKVKENYDLPSISLTLEQMEQIALEKRPEVLESRYKQRISKDETKTAILKMLPGVNLNAGISYDDNDYLLNNDWISYGASMSWNLLNVFKYNTYEKLSQTQYELAKQQKLAISMAVLSQVHLSVVNFKLAQKEFYLSDKYYKTSKEIFKITQTENKLNINSKLFYIKEKLNYILASLRYAASYANVQNSYGKIYYSLGIDEIKK